CAPLAFGGMGATARVADDSLAGRRPRVFRSLGTGLRHVLSSIAAAAVAVAGFGGLVVASPVISVVGILGLVLTPLVRLVRRWRPTTLGRWPSWRTLLVAAVPLAPAVLWATRWSMVIPANVLAVPPGERRRSLAALRRSSAAARGRWGTVA